jgi:dTMP kinase
MSLHKGKWIVVEGRDGSGKTSVRTGMGERIEALYPDREVVYCREAGGTPIAEQLRNLVVYGVEGEDTHIDTEILMFFAARVQLYRVVILPALARGAVVVSDRNWISSLMYQGHGSHRAEKVQALIDEFLDGVPNPDLYLYLDIDPSVANLRMRVARPQADNIDCRGPEFFKRVGDAYDEWAQSGRDNVAVINANKPFDEVMVAVMMEVEHLLDAPLPETDMAIVKELSA